MRVLLRCDGGPGIGVGHVTRSLALAEEATARGHEVTVLGALRGCLLERLAADLERRVAFAGPSVSDAPHDLAAAAYGFDVVHVDHYGVPDGLWEVLETAHPGGKGPAVSVLADGRFGARRADLLIDPTITAERSPSPAPATWHCRGARYHPLRGSVRRLRGAGPARAGDLTVLVVMGGADPVGCAPLVIDALAATGVPCRVTVVSAPRTESALRDRASRWRTGQVRVTGPVADLPEAMASADLVISAAGTSVGELCALGRPMALVAVVDNQRAGYDAVLSAGAAVGLGAPEDLLDTAAAAERLRPVLESAALRFELGRRAAQLVDGLGAWRVVAAWESVRDLTAPTSVRDDEVRVRPAAPQDALVLWRWRNDPTTRSHSRSRAEVSLPEHLAWLEGTLARADRQLLVGEDARGPVGTVRWDQGGLGEWEVSITVAPERRGELLAAALLLAAQDWLHTSTAAAELTAYLATVNRANRASRRLFLSSGYLPDMPPDAEGFERFRTWVPR